MRSGHNSIKIERAEFRSFKIPLQTVLLRVEWFGRLTEWRATGIDASLSIFFN